MKHPKQRRIIREFERETKGLLPIERDDKLIYDSVPAPGINDNVKLIYSFDQSKYLKKIEYVKEYEYEVEDEYGISHCYDNPKFQQTERYAHIWTEMLEQKYGKRKCDFFINIGLKTTVHYGGEQLIDIELNKILSNLDPHCSACYIDDWLIANEDTFVLIERPFDFGVRSFGTTEFGSTSIIYHKYSWNEVAEWVGKKLTNKSNAMNDI